MKLKLENETQKAIERKLRRARNNQLGVKARRILEDAIKANLEVSKKDSSQVRGKRVN